MKTNFLQLQLLGRCRGMVDAMMEREAAEVVRMLGSFAGTRVATEAERRRKREWPTQVEFTFLCASAIYLPAAAGWDKADAREMLLEDMVAAGERLRVIPYDKPRATAFANLVRCSLPARI